MLKNKLDEYLNKFENKLMREPVWPSNSACKAYIHLLQREITGVYSINRSIQAAINNFVFTIAKSYTPDMAQVKGLGQSSAIFDKAKVFPIHTLEWMLAVLELSIHYKRELSWVADSMSTKSIRIMHKKYGDYLSSKIYNIMEDVYRFKSLDWNRTVYELLNDMYDNGTNYGIKVLEEIVWSIAKKSWATRDTVEIEEIINNVYQDKTYSKRTTIGIAFFSIAANIGAKAKKQSSLV